MNSVKKKSEKWEERFCWDSNPRPHHKWIYTECEIFLSNATKYFSLLIIGQQTAHMNCNKQQPTSFWPDNHRRHFNSFQKQRNKTLAISEKASHTIRRNFYWIFIDNLWWTGTKHSTTVLATNYYANGRHQRGHRTVLCPGTKQ